MILVSSKASVAERPRENELIITFIPKLHHEMGDVKSRTPRPMARQFKLGGTVVEAAEAKVAAEAEAEGGVCREGRQSVLSW